MPPVPFSSEEAQFAIEAVREAALLASRIQGETIAEALTKDDKSPVTIADFAVQALIARRLAQQLPGAALIGEEQSGSLQLQEGLTTLELVTRFVRTAIADCTPEEVCGLIDRGSGEPPSTFWVLDPIDGTKGFLRRQQYAVALALVREGSIVLGVLGCPALVDPHSQGSRAPGTLVAAESGRGTWAQPIAGSGEWRRFSVSSRAEPATARIMRSVEKSHTNVDEIGQLSQRLGVHAAPVPMDSQAKYAMLAAGKGDVLLRLLSPSRPDYREKIWDQAAGSIVVTEAGGEITDLDGRPLDFSRGRTLANNRGILATNGHLHDAFLDGLREVGA